MIREVLPQPVLPWRQSGELLPFSAFTMKSKIRIASFTLPGTLSTTRLKRSCSYGERSSNRSSRAGFGLGFGLVVFKFGLGFEFEVEEGFTATLKGGLGTLGLNLGSRFKISAVLGCEPLVFFGLWLEI